MGHFLRGFNDFLTVPLKNEQIEINVNTHDRLYHGSDIKHASVFYPNLRHLKCAFRYRLLALTFSVFLFLAWQFPDLDDVERLAQQDFAKVRTLSRQNFHGK
jgi:hypothetical protein